MKVKKIGCSCFRSLAIVVIFGKFLELFWYFGKLLSKEQGIFIEYSFFQNTFCKLAKFCNKKMTAKNC
jgi:hypothetical protein